MLFNRLPRSEISKIALLEVSKVSERLDDKDLTLHVSDDAVEWLAAAGYDPAYGARPVGRAVRSHLLNPLARAIIGHSGGATEGLNVLIDIQGGGGSGGSAAKAAAASSLSGGGSGGDSSASTSVFESLVGRVSSHAASPVELDEEDEEGGGGLRIRLVADEDLEETKQGQEWADL